MNGKYFISGEAAETEELIEDLQDSVDYEINPVIFNI